MKPEKAQVSRKVMAGWVILTLLAVGMISYRLWSGHQIAQQQLEKEREFITEMSAHHRETISLARFAEEKATTPEVQDLAKAIRERTRAQLEELGSRSRAWHGESPGNPDADSLYGVTGDRHQFALSRLRTAEDVDKMFLAVMIPHHEGAVFLAGRAADSLHRQEIKDFALSVIAKDQQEIDLMQSYVRSGFPSSYHATGGESGPAL